MPQLPYPEPRTVLVTGSAGAVARGVLRELVARGHRVRGFDHQPTPAHFNLHETLVGDLTDRDAVRRAVDGCDTIVHLAAYPLGGGDFLDDLLGPNVIGLYHVVDAARHADAPPIRRLILASSMQVVQGVKAPDRLLTAEDSAPDNYYSLTKRWSEVLGEMAARRGGLSVICARIGWLPRDAEDAGRLEEHRGWDAYLSHADAGRFFADAVEAEGVGYEILYAVSRPLHRARVELDSAKQSIGYGPRDTWPGGLDFEYERIPSS